MKVWEEGELRGECQLSECDNCKNYVAFCMIKNIGRKDLRAVGGEMMISVLNIINLEFTEDVYSVTWFDCRKNES